MPGSVGGVARTTKIAPSILSADFACLAEDVERVAAEADLLHVDVMDGHFVPNLTIGPPVVASLRARTELFLDCHLMVDNPGVLLDDFAEAGADRCIVHIELGDPRPLFDRAPRAGAGRRSHAQPRDPVDAVLPYLGEIDLLLVMSVHPASAASRSSPRSSTRCASPGAPSTKPISRWRSRSTAGSTSRRRRAAAAAGVDILVAGSAIFRGAGSGGGRARDPRTARRVA